MPQIPHARYADALASLARLGLVEFGRQSLVGGHYALLDADFQPNPDLYVGILWKRLVGTAVLNASLILNSKEDASKDVHAYAHCGRADGAANVVVVIVNISPSTFLFTSDLFRLGGKGWTLTGPFGFFSKSVALNGDALKSVSDAVSAKGAELTPAAPLRVPPYSIGFATFPIGKDHPLHGAC